MNRKYFRPPRARQNGMTLVIGLILLVMLMVISVIGFRNTTLSERMTGNALDRSTSFQSAESAGKEALTQIAGATALSGLGYYDASNALTKAGGSQFWTSTATPPAVSTPATDCFTSTIRSADVFNWSCAAQVTTKYANNAANALYAIELIASQSACVSSILTNSLTYRVTSKSTGGSGQAEVVLQTLFNKTSTGTC